MDTINKIMSLPKHNIKTNYQTPTPKPYTPSQFVNYFNQRYSVIKTILQPKAELTTITSINKSNNLDKFSLIAMVREKIDSRGVILEDPTGEIKISLGTQQPEGAKYIADDEVMGFVCERDGETVVAKKLIYPDITLKKGVTKTQENLWCLFILLYGHDIDKIDGIKNATHKITEDIQLIVIGVDEYHEESTEGLLKKLPAESQKIILSDKIQQPNNFHLTPPATINISGVNVLLLIGDRLKKYIELFESSAESAVLNLIKKRHMDPIFTPTIYENDPFLLQTPPDVLTIFNFGSSFSFTYKGMTIISLGDDEKNSCAWLLNLKTRETIKIDCS